MASVLRVVVVDVFVKATSVQCSQYSTAVVVNRPSRHHTPRNAGSSPKDNSQSRRRPHRGTKYRTISSIPRLDRSAPGMSDHTTEYKTCKAKLESGFPRKLMRVSREETEAKISTLEHYQRRIMNRLQIDQTSAPVSSARIDDGLIRAPIARKPHFTVPFPRDLDFLQRPAIQAWLQEQQADTASRIALGRHERA
ncbi:vegetative incompatibility protein HET-E-1 [Trichoderma ceciliae]